MRWPNLFRTIYCRGQFIDSNRLQENKDSQIKAIRDVLNRLDAIDIHENEAIKLEYFFCTNKLDKAKKIAKDIRQLNYSVSYAEQQPGKLFLITGWTTNIHISNDVVSNWVTEMCELGYKHDCDFEGWGTDGRCE